MRRLLSGIEKLKKSKIKKEVDKRIKEFKGKKSADRIFSELCFCILTANFNAEKAIKIQKKIKNGFLVLPEKKLAKKLKKLGYRYPNTRARYIVEARKHRNSLKKIIGKKKAREFLVENVKGLGYKEASHFLRNVGCKNCAIIDFHIIDLLVKNKLIKKPKTLSRKKYLEIENLLKKLAKKLKLNLAELDLYLWFVETGKVLK